MLRTVRKDVLEDTVIGALQHRMMAPETYCAYAQESKTEWNRLQAETSSDQSAKQAELGRLRQQLE